MALLWRALLVLVVFVGCGVLTAKLVMARGVAGGAPAAQIRLSGAMAGLFAGGLAATVVLLMVTFGKRR